MPIGAKKKKGSQKLYGTGSAQDAIKDDFGKRSIKPSASKKQSDGGATKKSQKGSAA